MQQKQSQIIGPLPPSRMRVNNTVSVPTSSFEVCNYSIIKTKRPGIFETIVNTVPTPAQYPPFKSISLDC